MKNLKRIVKTFLVLFPIELIALGLYGLGESYRIDSEISGINRECEEKSIQNEKICKFAAKSVGSFGIYIPYKIYEHFTKEESVYLDIKT